ncbi:VPLPA-CTERM sorting domain-containing protein [Roseobacter sp. N2S]|uniref:VPLPA-CTERM sorting domain-containing protein n=1 Tax=Roseobacter sp. N2S TaxID=2663844 RepID=UPI002862D5EC|nr:VPLPA-CTERM sorting domain-containing protein [Roseobacter sp. N2S]MDR6265272.1 hypothetical protein [Roseobacter sp. N2S]
MPRIPFLSIAIISGLIGFGSIGSAATLAIDATRLGYTSKGGINQARTVPITGTFATYGDVFKAHYIFDFSSFVGSDINVTSLTLELGVHSFMSGQVETLTVGGYSGDLSVLKTDNFRSPTFATNRNIYPDLVEAPFGEVTLGSQTSAGDVLSIGLNGDGQNAAQVVADTDGLTEFALGTSFGIPVWGAESRYLGSSSARLIVNYDELNTPTPVPLPAGLPLLLAGLGGLGLLSRRKRSS